MSRYPFTFDDTFDEDLDNTLDRALLSVPQQRQLLQLLAQIAMASMSNLDVRKQLSLGRNLILVETHAPLLRRNTSSASLQKLRDHDRARAIQIFFQQLWARITRKRGIQINSEPQERIIRQGVHGYPNNAVSNAKYNPVTFIPLILYEQFKFFFNLYFLMVALSQAIPHLRIGYLSLYIVPLAFVLTVTMMKEAGDDIARRRRDRQQNNELYEVLVTGLLSGEPRMVHSKDLAVGDCVRVHKGKRVPADMVLLQTSETTGETFIKTDQLDGETDWKLRVAPQVTQQVASIDELITNAEVVVPPPAKLIHSFTGKLNYENTVAALLIDQTLWANTVLALGTAIGMVVYTGPDTRQAMNTTKTGVKTGLLELEINSISKLLCATVFILSVVLVLAHGFPLESNWYLDIMRFLILFSTIIPVSLRVNLDLAKSVYANQIQSDDDIPDTIVRTSTIPEDLGRIEYLLSDKTGTLTQNDMEMKKLHLGTVSYAGETMDMVLEYVRNMTPSDSKKRDLGLRVCDLVLTLALCHNVTPTYDDVDDEINGLVTYQAASPDEIAIVQFCEEVGLKLVKRDRNLITLMHLPTNRQLKFKVLYNFPFNSDTKRMGILVCDEQTNELWFLQKGADTVMLKIVQANDWLDEETGNMAREGLRTLVIGRKRITPQQFEDFEVKYKEALISMISRDTAIQKVISKYLEQDLELLGLTGVEDKLQPNVKQLIELLRQAGIKIWMLTGDKVETARCVLILARLISRGQYVHQITKLNDLSGDEAALTQLDFLRNNPNACLLIDGELLGYYMLFLRDEFFTVVKPLPAVICCRCLPQQKADVAMMIRQLAGKRVCCIGDGGNDVSMIQCADVGVGIVGKEGNQASLAADFSILSFSYLSKLLLWHGRNSYKRSAKLGQFIIHRGLLISVAQAVFSISSLFEPLALVQGWLMVGYATVYTMAPVFSLTLDTDIDEHLTRLYPELYKELTLGKLLLYRTFFMWVLISLWQGCVIQILSQWFQGYDEKAFKSIVALSYTLLIINELVMVALLVNRWTKIMAALCIITGLIYVALVPFLGEYFNLAFMTTLSFYWQLALILAVSLFPVWLSRYIDRKLRPPSYAKVQQD